MSPFLKGLREEPHTQDREKPEIGYTDTLPDLSATIALFPEAVGFTGTLAPNPRRLYQLTTELFGYRVKAYRDEASGAYLLPVESCGHLLKYGLKAAFPDGDFIIKTRRYAAGLNQIVVFTNLLPGATEWKDWSERYCGVAYDSKTGVVTVKPPTMYKGQPIYFNCSGVKWITKRQEPTKHDTKSKSSLVRGAP